MLKALFGSSSLTSMLRGGLEEVSATQRAIAARVAGDLGSSSSVDFEGELKARAGQPRTEEDLQQDMAALADTELRYEASAKLLQAAYARLRSAVKDRA
jgi:hypothetical protein